MWYSSFWSEGPKNHRNLKILVSNFVPRGFEARRTDKTLQWFIILRCASRSLVIRWDQNSELGFKRFLIVNLSKFTLSCLLSLFFSHRDSPFQLVSRSLRGWNPEVAFSSAWSAQWRSACNRTSLSFFFDWGWEDDHHLPESLSELSESSAPTGRSWNSCSKRVKEMCWMVEGRNWCQRHAF